MGMHDLVKSERTKACTYPTSESLKRIHAFLVDIPIFVFPARSAATFWRICPTWICSCCGGDGAIVAPKSGIGSAVRVRPVRLHVAHFLVQAEIVLLQVLDFQAKLSDGLKLFAQFLQGRSSYRLPTLDR